MSMTRALEAERRMTKRRVEMSERYLVRVRARVRARVRVRVRVRVKVRVRVRVRVREEREVLRDAQQHKHHRDGEDDVGDRVDAHLDAQGYGLGTWGCNLRTRAASCVHGGLRKLRTRVRSGYTELQPVARVVTVMEVRTASVRPAR